MKIGVPTEIKPLEGRVGLIPQAAGEIVHSGHQVYLQAGAGLASGFSDEDYLQQGVEVVPDAEQLYGESELIVKVKEPVDPELDLLRENHILFSYLHLAALPELTRRLCDIGLTAVGFETVEEHGGLPLLAPMSDIAGRIAVQAGIHYLHRTLGGKGIMLAGMPSVPRGNVVIMGAGHAGGNSARMAASLGAKVTVFDKKPQKLAEMHHLAPNISALYPYRGALEEAVAKADLLIGAVLVPGARAPNLVSRELVRTMEPRSVIVDIAVDQGGCVETIKPTTYEDPVYVEEDVLHFGVTNMPGAVPKTSSVALSASLTPYVLRLASKDWRQDQPLVGGINVDQGKVVHPALL